MTSLGYAIAPSRSVQPYVDMYQASTLLRPATRTGSEEYIIWAASTGSLSTLESGAFVLDGDPTYVSSSAGVLVVGAYSDGSSTLFVKDSGGRDLASVETLTLIRGDTLAEVAATFASQDATTGAVVLSAGTLTSLGGGFSEERGDTVSAVTYILAAPKFWWSRNDQDVTRFGWDGKAQRWAPLKGGPPQNLGVVLPAGGQFKLSLPLTRFAIGDTVPGDALLPDDFALFRAGVYPDAIATPLEVLVVSNADAAGAYPVSGALYDAVVGATNGILQINPTWATANAGLTLWYNAESFSPDATGDLGSLAELPTDSVLGFPALSPVPGVTDYPFVRLGFRRYLSAVPYASDALLPIPSGVSEGTFAWSQTTGKIVLSDADIKKATPGEATYDIAFLEAHVFYDGVSLSTRPVPLRTATPCLDSTGADLIGTDAGGAGIPLLSEIFVKRGVPLPPPGASGVLFTPDQTGTLPSGTTPVTRPNGSGLVRNLEQGSIGDAFFFTSSSSFQDLAEEELDSKLPFLAFSVPRTRACAARELAPNQPTGYTDTSRVQINRKPAGEALYFLQAQVTPSVYSEQARLLSRFIGPYVLVGTEVLRFNIDGTTYTWNAATNFSAGGSFSAAAIAADIDLVISGTGSASVIQGRVALSAGNLATGSVEIGWNATVTDLSGHAALGFLPSWKVDASGSAFRWQADNGAAIGLFRSPQNLDRANSTPDIRAVGQFTGRVLTKNVPATPFFMINNPPLEDLPGYDDGVHFQTSLGFNQVSLRNYGTNQGIGIKYDWGNDRLIWTAEESMGNTPVQLNTYALQLSTTGVIPETVSSLAMDPTGADFGLYLRGTDGSPSAELTYGSDFLLPGEGAPGQALLIYREGAVIATGGGGTFTAGGAFLSNPVLSPDAAQNTALQLDLFNAVEVGHLLQVLNGESTGVYEIVAKVLNAGTAEIYTAPEFPEAGSGISWQITEAQIADVYDPTLLADVQLVPFNHLPEEPYKIRVLSSTGTVGAALVADVVDARRSNRTIKLRFGLAQPPAALEATPEYLLTGVPLGEGELGAIRETGMVIPDLTDPHFTESTGATSYFKLRVGASTFSLALANLDVVAVFSVLVPSGTVEVGQFGTGIAGQIKFADDLLLDLDKNPVYYDQIFRAAANLAAGEAEIDPTSGSVNLSSADATAYVGETCYLVETMVTEERLDVTVSPLNGAIFFNKPLREGQIVETEYKQADSNGAPKLDDLGAEISVIEYLPLMVRLEVATLVTSTSYSFNPDTKTLSQVIDPFIWVGAELQNYAGATTATVDYASSLIAFATAVDPLDVVKINYGVLEAFGGEQAYNVSTTPVYRPPFFLLAGQSSFTLETNRTADVYVGQLMMIGAVPFYIKSSTYDAGADTTTVTIWPPPLSETGSRAPGKDERSALTDVPVAITIDPDGVAIAGGGAAGFLLLTAATLLPVDRGSTSFLFEGDLQRYARARHLLEVDGYPHIITGSSLSEDGRYTTVSVANPAYAGFGSGSTIRISVRPVYEPFPMVFEGLGSYLESEGRQLLLVGPSDKAGGLLPGRELIEGVHYSGDSGSGAITLLSPVQAPLQPGERLFFHYTGLLQIGPVVVNNAVIPPTYKAKYLYATVPSLVNRILGATLSAKYTFRAPDTFYLAIEPIPTYLAEVAEIALSKVSQGSRTGGFVEAFPGSPELNTQGSLGLRGSVHDLNDQDRAARAYISLFNDLIVGFEQIQETINGGSIGDRDGKFRFFVGRDRVYAPPGYEDVVTGEMNPRFIWSDVFEAANGSFGVTSLDPIVDPETATQDPVTLEVTGDMMNPWLLDFYIRKQKVYCLNDMDDVALRGKERTGLQFFPFSFKVTGDFKEMWYPSVISRLYPESSLAFTTTYPGIGAGVLPTDPGVYSFAKIVSAPSLASETGPVLASTFGTDIGTVSNPSLGTITGITGQVRARERLARARIWAYSATGFPDLDPASDGLPSVIATPLPLGEFPLDPTTGMPDLSQLTAQGGSLPDLSTGDVELSCPRWCEPYGSAAGVGYNAAEDVYPQVSHGTPDGALYQLGVDSGFISSAIGIAFDTQIFKGVYVSKVLSGCIITFTDGDAEITNADSIIKVTETGSTLPFVPVRGDTIFVVTPRLIDASAFSDPPTSAEMKKFAKNQPFLDVGVKERSSSFVDHSLPSIEDPSFPIKELVNQKAALPLQCIEADVEFVNAMVNPHKFPALLGLATNDAGDHTIPYLLERNTELTALGAVAGAFNAVVMADNGTSTAAAYPDEILGTDGQVTGAAVGAVPPATLLTTSDLTPVATAGVYTPRSGIADVRAYDLLLVEAGQAGVPSGATGILSIGAVTTSTIEPPRFVTKTLKGDRIRYAFNNAMAHLTSTGLSGVTVSQVGPNTEFDISSVGGLFLNDGSGAATGGLNNLVGGAFPGNVITIRLISQATGLVVETIVYNGNTGIVTGGAGAVATAAPTFTQKVMTVPVLGFVTHLGAQFDFTVTVNTYNAGAATAGSVTAYIADDRLTFSEEFDMTSVLPRGTLTIGGVLVGGGLGVTFVTASGNVACNVNAPPEVNSNQTFSFLARDAGQPLVIGTFDPSPGTEEGTVKVMGFEGAGNTPIVSTSDVTFSALASADQGANAIVDILSGTASILDGTVNIQSIVAGAGAIDTVEKGDIVVIKESSIGNAAVKAGTYLVRHAIPVENAVYALPDTFEASLIVGAGSSSGWAPAPFPIVSSTSVVPFQIFVSGHLTISTSPSGHNFPAAGTLYIILDPVNPAACLAVDYGSTAVVGDTLRFDLTIGSGRYGDGATLIPVDATFMSLVSAGATVSGMAYLPVQGITSKAANNVVGFDDAGVTSRGGFAAFTIKGQAANTWTAPGGDIVVSTGAVPAAGQIGVWVSDAPGGTYTGNSQSFYSDENTLIYEDVPFLLDLTAITTAQWDTIHGTVGTAMECLLPGETIAARDAVDAAGFIAVSGVYLEPSFPRPTLNLSGVSPRVVDLTHTLPSTQVGMRSSATFGGANPELVSFEVRRIRRFHDLLDGITSNLTPLRFAYEIRTGTVTSWNSATNVFTAAGSTQLGSFDNADVNINPGDIVRVLDGNGVLLDSAEVASVTGGTTLKLRRPGFTTYPPVGGEVFQIYLRQAPVPHAQSNEQLLDLVTSEVLLASTRDPVTNDGGRVTTTNKLRDNSVLDFTDPALDIQQDDIILVDPAGALTGPTGAALVPETGARPIGDQSVSVRLDGSYSAGGPSELDDNRGWYRVVSLTSAEITITPITEFSGAVGSPVVFGSTAQEYVVLPDINSSGAIGPSPGGPEGQMDLRMTAVAGTDAVDPNSYLGNSYSIEPFSYKIFRPTSLLSKESIDLVLLLRERMLSWMEEINLPSQGTKSGSYYVFQRDEHVSDIGAATDPTSGLGVPSNAFVTSVSGLTQYAPFANVSDCLSVLDRRYWCMDLRLDTEEPPYSVSGNPYSSFEADNSSLGYTVGSGRPVEPDLIEGVLDRTDVLRDQRYGWINFRAARLNGSIVEAARAEEQLPLELSKARALAAQKRSLNKIS